ncbi:MAG: MlaD family protein [Solirubrobacterales bacterium]
MSKTSDVAERGASTPARLLAGLALIVAIAGSAALLLSGESGFSYRLVFETGGQLVTGNQVSVAGQPIGTIDDIDLTEDSQAAIDITVDQPLREGTSAVIRLSSLSGVANRYIALQMGPDNAPEIPDGGVITTEETTTAVDLDQLFDVFRKPERRALQKFIQGNADVYSGKGRLANRAYKFLNPALSSSEALFSELSRDSQALERFLVEGATVFGAIADRRTQLTSLISDANTALGAVADRNVDLDRSLSLLPGVLRQGNTTFVNLRATLDDVDPLVAASKPATRDLAPFLRNLRGVAESGNPVFDDLANVVRRPGPSNDLADLLVDIENAQDAAARALPAAIDAMDESQDEIAFLRPYAPDLFGFLADFGIATSFYDASGHYARVMPAGSNIFERESDGELDSIYNQPNQQYDALDFGIFRRCPGGATQPAADGSNPFLDDGALGIDDCDPSDLPPGP